MRRAAFGMAMLLVLGSGCARSGCARSRGTFDGAVFRDGPIAFELPSPPPSWRRVEVEGASLAFRDDPRGATVLVNARCRKPDEDTPLVALTNQLVIGSTERAIASQATEPFDGREVLHTRMTAKWDGVLLAHDLFVLKKDGCIYDFVYTGPPGGFDEGAAAFERFVRGFRTLPGAGTVRS